MSAKLPVTNVAVRLPNGKLIHAHPTTEVDHIGVYGLQHQELLALSMEEARAVRQILDVLDP